MPQQAPGKTIIKFVLRNRPAVIVLEKEEYLQWYNEMLEQGQRIPTLLERKDVPQLDTLSKARAFFGLKDPVTQQSASKK